jgi:HemY protein
MLRAFGFAIVALIVLALVWFIAALPGHITIDFGNYVATAPTPIAILLLAIVVLILILIAAILRALLRSPGRLAARRAATRRNNADSASLRALSAMAAGDDRTALNHARIAQRNAPDAPLTLYVAGETARRSGDHAAADAHFAALAQHKDAGFLGWRGLVTHRTQLSGNAAALAEAEVQARQAAVAYPNSVWLRDQRTQLANSQGQYADAARLATDPPARAALAIMASRTAPTERLAIDWARDAVRTAPDLAPAYLALAAAHERAGHMWRAKRALVAGWKAAPQPDIATAYLAPSKLPLDRASAAQKLASHNLGHPESEALLARTARAADLTVEAERHEAKAIAASGTTWVCRTCDTTHAQWNVTCRKCDTIGSLAWIKPPPDPAVALLPSPVSASQPAA